MVLLPIGLLAGAITTVAGMGGGLVMVLLLSTVWEPITALAVTTPALLVGNLHRLRLYRADVVPGIARSYALGAFPGALVGGLVAVALPEVVIRTAMVGLALLAAGVVLSGKRPRVPLLALGAGGAGVGFVSATTGGGGLVAGPMLLAAGLTGRPYVASAAVGAVAVHCGRILGYGAGGVVDRTTLLHAVVLAVAVAAGNLLGDRIRPWLSDRGIRIAELGTVFVCLSLALVGLG